MSNRPLGMYLVCGFFGFLGIGSFIAASIYNGMRADIPPGQPQSVHLFTTLLPIFALIMGLLGMFAAVTLWLAYPIGRTSGLVWVTLWVLEEIVMGIWAATGPEIVRQASSGVGGNLLRILVASVLFYYLWTIGATYVDDERTNSSSSTVAHE